MRWTTAAPPSSGETLAELWQYRELIGVFVLRDLQVRYRQTAIGVAWVVLQPLVQMVLLSGFFQWLGRIPARDAAPYPVVLLTGLLLWQLFAQGVQQATVSLLGQRALITKVYFPRLIVPLAAVLTPLVDFLVAWPLLWFVSWLYGVPVLATWLWAPLCVAATILTALAVGLWTSLLNALYRDIGHAVPFLLQVGFFVSAVVYETRTVVPEQWQPLLALNPMTTIIDLHRAAWLGSPLPTALSMGVSTLALVALLVSGHWYFQTRQQELADRV